MICFLSTQGAEKIVQALGEEKIPVLSRGEFGVLLTMCYQSGILCNLLFNSGFRERMDIIKVIFVIDEDHIDANK